MALRAGFDLAALVISAGLLCILVADVYFDASEEIVETLQPLLYGRTDPLMQLDTAGDVVAVDLNMHTTTPD
jgi:hypothetical protein